MKSIKILLTLIFIFMVTGCFNKGKGYTEISYEALMKKLDNKESFILMIGSSNCTHCDEFKLTLEEINKKYSINVQYIDIYKIKDDAEKLANLKKISPYSGTPTTVNIVDGKEETILSRIEGSRDYSDTKDKLIKWGYIKE